MRSFVTALVFYFLASTAGAQCSSPAAPFKAGTSSLQELYSASIENPNQGAKPRPGAIVKTAVGTPATRTPATRMGQSAPQASAQRARTQTSRYGSAGLYAAIAVMAAIALRRRGR